MARSQRFTAFLVVALVIASNYGALGQASPPPSTTTTGAATQASTASPSPPPPPATPSTTPPPAMAPQQAAAEAEPPTAPAPAPTPMQAATPPTTPASSTQTALQGDNEQKTRPPVPSPPATPAGSAIATEASQAASSSGGGCKGGCIAGAVVGAVVGLAIIAVLGFFVYKWTSGSGGVGKSKSRQLDAQPYKPPATATPPTSGKLTAAPASAAITTGTGTSTLPYTAGQHVSIKLPGGALPGTVVSCTSKSVEVKPNGRQVCTVKMSEVARLYQVHEKVLYVDPVSQKSRVAAIVSADGTSWPPFYRINFANETGAIDTVQSQLKPWT